jgi:hypothetical protein
MLFSLCGMDTSVRREGGEKNLLPSTAVVATLNYELYIYIYIYIDIIMSFTKQRILVVDDEADVNLTIKLALEDEGFEVNTFDSPQQDG